MEHEEKFAQAAAILKDARGLVVTAGAGMGVDSGLPDFRGNQGFWRAYPPYERLGLSFYEAANPVHFEQDPSFGWGFYGHRTNLYRQTEPHQGFFLLLEWAERLGIDVFVVTSNVDGQFQKAGFPEDGILEVHGSIHHLQCLKPCTMEIWPNRETITIDLDSMRSQEIPRCPRCQGVARPNILMFGDYSWISSRSARQEDRFDAFLQHCSGSPLAVVELGAGTAVPTIRHLSERLGQRQDVSVIRINPREPSIRPPHLSIACGALEGLLGIESFLN